MKYNDENIEKLAQEVIDSWDMSTLMNMALKKLINDYKEDEELFNLDVELMF